jgi:hypothetical protein
MPTRCRAHSAASANPNAEATAQCWPWPGLGSVMQPGPDVEDVGANAVTLKGIEIELRN